jgi:alanine racemase
MTPLSTLEVDLSAVRHNVQQLLRVCREHRAPNAATFLGACAALKADAYGMGAVPVARALNDLVYMFAVYTLDEAMQIVESVDSTKPVLVLMPVNELPQNADVRAALDDGRIHLVIHDRAQASELLAQSARDQLPLNLHVQVDTGMCRGGCAPDHLGSIVSEIATSKTAKLIGLMTHLASADNDPEFTRLQFDRFRACTDSLAAQTPRVLLHIANTFATLRSPAYHLSMIRPGIGLLGYGPEMMTGETLLKIGDLRPALRWVSQIVQVKQIQPGDAVGYNRAWTAQRPSRIGLIPAGYADGYPLQSLAQRHVAIVVGESRGFAPVIGKVNMDQITVDLTDVSAGTGIGVGTEVELITPDPAAPNHSPTLARHSGSHAYELATGIGRRVIRKYV